MIQRSFMKKKLRFRKIGLRIKVVSKVITINLFKWMIRLLHLSVLGVLIFMEGKKTFLNTINASIVLYKSVKLVYSKKTHFNRSEYITNTLLAVFLKYLFNNCKMIKMMILLIIFSYVMKLVSLMINF